MAYEAIIYKVESFSAMVEPANSRIRFWVVLPDLHTTVAIDDAGTIPELTNKYKFLAQEHHWDLSNMLKKDCIVELGKEHNTFIRYK